MYSILENIGLLDVRDWQSNKLLFLTYDLWIDARGEFEAGVAVDSFLILGVFFSRMSKRQLTLEAKFCLHVLEVEKIRHFVYCENEGRFEQISTMQICRIVKIFVTYFLLSAIVHVEGLQRAPNVGGRNIIFWNVLKLSRSLDSSFKNSHIVNKFVLPLIVPEIFRKICFRLPTLGAVFTPSTWTIPDNKT